MCFIRNKCFVVLGMALMFIPVAAQENQWVKLGDFIGGKRERAVSFSIENYGYVGTGTDTAEIVHDDFWKYDPSSDTWSQIASLPGAARRDAVAFSLNGHGYVGTGMTDDVSAMGIILADFWRYDPTLNVWDSIAPYPGNNGGGVYFSTGFSVAGKGYVCGGKTGNSAYSNELWEYKPASNVWFPRAPFPTGIRYMHSSFAIGNYAYVGFGATQDVYKRDLYRYNPGNNQWLQMPDLPGNVRGSASTFVLQDKGYICGGNDGGLLDDLWEFDPLDQTWTLKAYYGGSERKNAISFSINNSFAVVGLGKGYSGKKASLYAYYPNQYLGQVSLEKEKITVFPNPGRMSIEIKNTPKNTAQIVCYNALGQQQEIFRKQPETDAFANYPSGVYILRFLTSQGEIIDQEKLIIE